MSFDYVRDAMTAHAAAVEQELDALIGRPAGATARLTEAMRHAALGGGKRLRPFLVHAVASLGTADRRAMLRVGAAIELLHSYSLVHDDLPSMDDALLRRGRASCHKAFGEATAILAGDALQALALEALVRPDVAMEDQMRAQLVLGLARAAGAAGMCGGQLIDLAAERQELDEGGLVELQRLKTGALIEHACDSGAILGGSTVDRAAIGSYAAALGLAFQIADDILDATSTAEQLGKPSGADAVRGKATFVRLLGLEGARSRLARVKADGLAVLDKLGSRAFPLRDIFEFVVNRSA